MDSFAELQARLPAVLAANRPGSREEHLVVGLPSYSLGTTILGHYQPLLAPLEHRFLLGMLMLTSFHAEEFVLITCGEPDEVLLDYYARLADPDDPERIRRRFHVVVVPDDGPRAVATKLLDRPDLIAEVRELIDGRPGMIESWNVTDAEVAVARALQLPVNGTPPELWPLGFKSAGRRLFVRAGVPVSCGREDIHDAREIAQAIAELRTERPGLDKVVVKQDNSGYGDGNWLLETRQADGSPIPTDRLAAHCLDDAPDLFAEDLAAGGVVEEWLTGRRFSSPSAQLEIRPDGQVHLLSTHEQLIGGATGQTFTGCLFPADSEYAALLGRYALAIGKELASEGALGRLAVDFVTVHDGTEWAAYALEVNLRKGGTTHPYTTLRYLVPGRYDDASGDWVADSDGRPRCYRAVDAYQHPRFTTLAMGDVIDAVQGAGVHFDPGTGTGVVLHMLGALVVDGRMGYIAIGRDRAEAEELGRRTEGAVARLAGV